jgi:pimeloyl-ACP methyl ester carboxylesterase
MTTSPSVPYQSSTVNGWATFAVPLAGAAESMLRSSPNVAEAAPDPLPTPPLLSLNPSWVQPLNGPAAGARGRGEAEGFLLPADLSQVVAPGSPIRADLRLSPEALGDTLAVLPVAYDGEYFYLAGRPVWRDEQEATTREANRVQVEVTRLPDLTAAPPAAASAERLRFNVWRGIKLGFFKLVGIPTPELGLRVPSVASGKVTYRVVANGELGQGRVALLVHGFLSDTGWMAQALLGPLRSAGYAHVVTWDYETFTSPIRATLQGLTDALHAAGVASGSGRVDVIAHSMGSLVSRSLIAQQPALGLVRRGLLIGAPNAGTPIAGVGDAVTELASSLINVSNPLASISLRALVSFLWHRIDRGLADLQEKSDLTTWINGNPVGQAAPLTLLVGDAAADPLRTAFQRALHVATDLFYGGPNDLVVPVASMKAVATPPYPDVVAQDVPSNHFDYLISGRPARAVVDKWIVTP